jgi:prepilin-type N-terminal cleavage/methylation domain-containing protein
MTRQIKRYQRGFTLVELMLALAFVGFVMIFVVLATLEVMGNYNKGVAIKQINQTARTVVEDMGRLVRLANAQAIIVPAASTGRVCFGGVSYVWNIRGGTTNKYNNGTIVGFARVDDASGAMCTLSGGRYPRVPIGRATEIVTSDVWVQALTVSVASNQQLVSISLTLSTSGTNQPTGPGSTCVGGKVGEYCAVATFSTTVNTRNGG